jgi:hypothetical protein
MRFGAKRNFLCALALLLAGGVAADVSAQGVSHAAAAFRYKCMNTYSGWKWNVTVDLENRMVDQAYPASISNDTVWWRDTKEGADFKLNRATGALIQYNASSMGGNMLFHKCEGG